MHPDTTIPTRGARDRLQVDVRKPRWRALLAAIAIVAVASGCASRGGTTYAPGETGALMRVEPARVVSSREVLISGLDNQQAAGWGTVVGATIAGAGAYGLTGADNPAGVAVTVIAAVVGGLAGLLAEERRETQPGVEYILEDETGTTKAVVQASGPGEGVYPPGAPVALIYGAQGYVRVVPGATS